MDQNPQSDKLCLGVESAFELLSRKWTGLIIHTLVGGEKHFCDIEKALPSLSARVLSLRMKELEDSGLVRRVVSEGPPVRVTYGLTAKGESMKPVIQSIEVWARQWAAVP